MRNMGEREHKSVGISIEDHTFMNGLSQTPIEKRRDIYRSMRAKYQHDALAVRQIDMFDSESPMGVLFQKLKEAKRLNDNAEAERLNEIFQELYPDLDNNP